MVESIDQNGGRPRLWRLLRRALAGLLLGGTAVVALREWFGVGAGLDLASEIVYDAVVLGAGIACLVRATEYRRERSAWLLIGAGIISWGAAEVYWTAFIEGNPSAPYPSPADVGYLAFYPLAYAGLAVLVRARAHEINWRLWMDGMIAALGTAALGAAFVFDFVANHATGTALEKLTTLAYPLGDIGMLSLVVGVVALTGWRPGRTWSLLLAGLSALVVADIAYTLQVTEATLPSGEWVNPIYLIAAVCLGATVWQPSEVAEITSPTDQGRRQIVVPAVFAAVMIGLFSMQYYSASGGLATVLWAATLTAVIVRLAMSDRENSRLLDAVRTDSLTGLGNRGRLQVDLPAICEQADTERPAMLYLFDLNGFKRYNDTFGHPAGDRLLRRFGGLLKDAIGEEGAAYRIGGDEFCLLLTCAEERFDSLAKAAAEALTASDRGVEVGAAWGAATIPSEADNPSAALQLADVRMYAQKESRRGAPTEIEIPTEGAAGPTIKASRG